VDMWRPFTNALRNGLGTADSAMTSSTFCSHRLNKPWMKCERQNFSARADVAGCVKGKRGCYDGCDELDSPKNVKKLKILFVYRNLAR